MKYGILFAAVAAALAASALAYRGWYLLLLWPAVSFGVVSLGYFRFGPIVFGKSSRGVISRLARVALLPYLIYLSSVWHALRLVMREPAFHQLTENVYIGRRLLACELPDNIDHIVDLTCEFSEPKELRSGSYYHFAILDGCEPSPSQLRQWLQVVSALSGPIYIHCAEGHGRTGLFAAGLLLTHGHCKTPEDALRYVTTIRPTIRLSRGQMAVLRSVHEAT